ncbi:MAG: hypothetical protein MZV64_67000 [Ignavibacteriales bacterium]|nr:hypothetical protein [Ignavibacteriales bacterium]
MIPGTGIPGIQVIGIIQHRIATIQVTGIQIIITDIMILIHTMIMVIIPPHINTGQMMDMTLGIIPAEETLEAETVEEIEIYIHQVMELQLLRDQLKTREKQIVSGRSDVNIDRTGLKVQGRDIDRNDVTRSLDKVNQRTSETIRNNDVIRNSRNE